MVRIRLGDLPGVAELKYLYRDKDRHGNHRLFARRFGRKIRLRLPEGSEEYFEEYKQALVTLAQPAPRSAPIRAERGQLRWLVERYYESAGYQLLDARTQRVRQLILDDICIAKGKKPYACMEARHVEAIKDAKAKTPEAANARVKALRQVFAWAVKQKLRRAIRHWRWSTLERARKDGTRGRLMRSANMRPSIRLGHVRGLPLRCCCIPACAAQTQ